MEIESNSKIISPEQLKMNLLNINKSLCNYINSLNKSPECLNETSKYSDQLIDGFTKFYDQFNILTEEALKDTTNQNQNNLSSAPKQIIIDYKIIKQFSNQIDKSLNKLKKKNNETDNVIQNYVKDLKEIKEYIKSKDQKPEK